MLLDFNDDQKADKKSKKKITNFFDENRSDDEDENQGIANGDDDDDYEDDDDDDSDIDMEITWQPGLKGKASNSSTENKTTKNKKQEKSNAKARTKEPEEEEEEEEEDSTENDQKTLQLLADDDDEIAGKRDFNLREMIKSHKQATKAATKNAKKSKKSQQSSSNTTEAKNNNNGDFQLNVDDKRFQAIYSQPAFNIDQSDPHFKPTAGTQRLIDEKLKKRKFDNFNSSSRTDRDEDDIVVKLKRKSAKKE